MKSKVFRAAYDEGDEVAIELIDEGLEMLGIAVANVVVTVDIDAVVVGGGLGERFGDVAVDRLAGSLAACASPATPPCVVGARPRRRAGAPWVPPLLRRGCGRVNRPMTRTGHRTDDHGPAGPIEPRGAERCREPAARRRSPRHRAPCDRDGARPASTIDRATGSSTASCPGSTSTPGSWPWPAIDDVPLLERAKFLAIFSSNLDEFFQVRVAGLKDQVVRRRRHAAPPTAARPPSSSREIRDDVVDLVDDQEQILLDEIVPALEAEGVRFRSWDQLDDDEQKALFEVFEEHIFPVLTPLAVDPGHPFPYISNLSLSLAVRVVDPESGEDRFARVKVPSNLDRFVQLPDARPSCRSSRSSPPTSTSCSPAWTIVEVARVPGHPQRRPDRRGGRGRRPARRRRGRAAAPPLRAGRPARDRRTTMSERAARAARPRARHRRGRRLRDRRPARPHRPVAHPRPRPSRPQGPGRGTASRRPGCVNDDDAPADFFAEIRRGDILVHHPYASFRQLGRGVPPPGGHRPPRSWPSR